MSSKKEPEVFNLLNLYQDDDDDDDDDDDMDDVEKNELQHETNNNDVSVEEGEFEAELREEEEVRDAEKVEDLSISDDDVNVSVSVSSTTTTRFSAVSPPPKWSSMRPPTPQQAVADSDTSRQRREKPSIVDYAHDDVAMSPEHEDGEFLGESAGRVMYGEDLEGTRDCSQGTPTVNVLTPNNQIDSSQLPSQVDVSQPDHGATKESAVEIGECVDLFGENGIDVDPVQNFLPPPPEAKCSNELQDKINKFLAYKRQGKSFNVEVRNRKDYRNPDFLRHAVRYQDIDEIGSNFSKDVFDPHGYDKSDYFDEIEADMKREMERKEQERKRSPKVDFVSGGTQVGIAAAQKVTLPSPGISNRPSGGSQSSSDMLTREGRQNKKSKWDKIDGDRRNVLGGGQETLSSVGVHAALLSAASAGAGYAAFTQQKRWEAEERRSSDKKAERRS